MANEQEKKEKALAIADDLEQLGYPEIADKLREAVTSGKPRSNEQTNEGGEGQGGTTTTPPTGGPQPPPDKERP